MSRWNWFRDFGAVLLWFQAAELLNAEQVANLKRLWEGTAAGRKATEALKDLRERLRSEIISWEGGRGIRSSTINELNGLMGIHPMLTKLVTRTV